MQLAINPISPVASAGVTDAGVPIVSFLLGTHFFVAIAPILSLTHVLEIISEVYMIHFSDAD